MNSLPDTEELRVLVEAKDGGDVVLSARGLCKAFGGQVVLSDVSVNLRRGEVILLRGENGSGKTTLVNILTGNLEPDAGMIQLSLNGIEEVFTFPEPWYRKLDLFGNFAPERLVKAGIGRTWQEVRLFSTQDLQNNVAVAVQKQIGENPAWAILKRSSVLKQEREISKTSAAMLDNLGLKGREGSSADKISLGQCKRVAIARAVRAGAKILFLDEPLAGLDATGARSILDLLKQLLREHNVTIIVVEHVLNIPLVLPLVTTVWTLAGGRLNSSRPWQVQRSQEGVLDGGILEWLKHVAGSQGSVKRQVLPGGAVLLSAIRFGAEETPILLEVKDLMVRRNRRLVIGELSDDGVSTGLSFSLRKGHLTILQAPNGWGKTTLLESLAGVLPIASGEIRMNGRNIESLQSWERARNLFFLQARDHFFPSCSVRESLRLAGVSQAPMALTALYERRISELSGGEKQKVAIAFMKGSNRLSVAVLDEPFSALDSKALADFQSQVEALIDEAGVLIAVPSTIEERRI